MQLPDALFAGHDVLFCALGTTRKDAGSAAAFRRIDFNYQVSPSPDVLENHFFSGSNHSCFTFRASSRSPGQCGDRCAQSADSAFQFGDVIWGKC